MRAVDFLASADGRALVEGCRDFFAIEPLLTQAARERWVERLEMHRAKSPGEAMECRRGGWLPKHQENMIGSLTASDVAYRSRCKAEGNFVEADLVRRVIEGGCVELRDYADGTMWIFQSW